ncbi:hypothetical protein BDR06DRAFT_955789 [Suillus hirtellus]|nr:hypothetical protein BDR06DRAFT_955789 [Suillus hirtellus]
MKLAFSEAFRRVGNVFRLISAQTAKARVIQCQLQSLYRVRAPGRLQQPVLVWLLTFSRPTYSPHTHRILSTKHSLCDVETADLQGLTLWSFATYMTSNLSLRFDYPDLPARTPENMDFAQIMETTTESGHSIFTREDVKGSVIALKTRLQIHTSIYLWSEEAYTRSSSETLSMNALSER